MSIDYTKTKIDKALKSEFNSSSAWLPLLSTKLLSIAFLRIVFVPQHTLIKAQKLHQYHGGKREQFINQKLPTSITELLYLKNGTRVND